LRKKGDFKWKGRREGVKGLFEFVQEIQQIEVETKKQI